MNVYIILRTIDYEDTDIVGVHTTREKAQAALDLILSKDQISTRWSGPPINLGKPPAHQFEIQEWAVE